jgi:WD40 repeat protein
VERNRIYERVFDRQWVRANMPDAEVRRQRAAFIKGVIRTAGLAVVVVAIVVSLAVSARRQADRAERSLYGADMILAQQALEAGNLGEARRFLEKYRPSYSRFGLGFSRNDLRGWEWRYLWTLSRSDELATLGKQPGNLGHVSHVAFSPDGRTLASGGHAVRLWKLESPGQFEILPHPEGGPDSGALAYSPSGLLLATGTREGTVRIWDVAAKQVTQVITNAAPIRSLRFSPDGKLLAVGPQRGPVKLWEVPAWREIASLRTQNDYVLSVGMAFTADSKTFAYGRENGSIVLWDVPARSPIATLTGHTAGAMSLQFSRDGSMLVSAATEPDNSVKAWNVPDRQLITNVATFGSWVGSVAFSPDEKFVAAASADQKIKFFEVATWKEVATLKGHLNEVWSIAFSPDGKTLASGGKDKTVRLWSAVPKPPNDDYMPLPPDLDSIRLSPQGDALLCAFIHGAPRVYDGATLKDIGQYPLPFSPGAYPAISSGGQLLAAGQTNGAITVWNVVRQVDGAILQTEVRAVHRLVFSPDGRMLAAAGADGRIELWDVATSNRFAAFITQHRGQRTQMRFSRDGAMLGVFGQDYYAPEIWSISRKEKVADLIGHEAGVNDVDLTGDKRTAATASWDGTLKLWDVETRKELASFHGQLRGYRCVTISPDDRRVAAGGSDGTIEIWDMNTRQAVAKLRGHKGHVFRAAFLPDNNTLVSVGDDGVRVWRALSLKQIDTEEKSRPFQE